jgi:hypothetical protein
VVPCAALHACDDVIPKDFEHWFLIAVVFLSLTVPHQIFVLSLFLSACLAGYAIISIVPNRLCLDTRIGAQLSKKQVGLKRKMLV